MIPHVTDARHLGDHRVWLRFDDGTEGELDLSEELLGGVFQPLRDPAYFANFSIEGWTLCWPNGADFAPEFLYERARASRAA